MYRDIWELVLVELEKKYSEPLMDLWFRNLELVHIDDKYAFILTGDESYIVNLLNSKYAETIAQALKEVTGFLVKVKIFSSKTFTLEDAILSMESPEPAEKTPAEVITEDIGSYKPKNQTFGITDADKDFTFENFVVGSSNKFAHAVSLAAANMPADAYNPLFIYGQSGIGKTHLMKAIANKVKDEHPDFKIIFVKGDDFTNEMIDALAKHNMTAFKGKYRNADMFLVDDVQFIAGKASIQEEFFHTFNTLFEDHKQIVLTSDRHPSEIQKLEERIRTRFEGGMIADIQSPDTELRISIAKKKAEMMKVDLSNEVLTFIGENVKSSIRQIEGVIKKLGAYSYITQTPITLDIAKNQLSTVISVASSPTEKAEKIIESVSKIYDVPVEDIKSKKRSKEISNARHVAVYVIRKITQMTVVDIGKIFNRDYTTILASIDVITSGIVSNPDLERTVNGLIKDFS